MRVFSFIPALAVLVTAVAGAALPVDDNCGLEKGCEVAKLAIKHDFFEHPTRTIHGLTNAALLRRGLPLKNPILRRGTPVRRIGPSGTPEPDPEPEPKPKPEPKTIHHRGIQIKRSSDNSVLGYVSSSTSAGAYLYSNINRALVVTFETDQTGSGTQLDLIPENSDIPNSKSLGLAQGIGNTNSVLSPGSYNYVYLASTHLSPPPWTFDSATGTLAPRWVNPDGSLPNVQYFVQNGVIYVGGDEAAFYARYPVAVTSITFEFIPL
ncbi:hypothetical protein BDM02DRAFT_3188819 [Thelephora ganbajun]|uniref:Uncharacterized protein n=1 Tax=Thelephora ganbajun TaxID=370292 RepID=A0ACB6Z9R7_THEGA|nr:hypothetical protein BDM02DRAFT_3188819 [Thelephora ganbajun]